MSSLVPSVAHNSEYILSLRAMSAAQQNNRGLTCGPSKSTWNSPEKSWSRGESPISSYPLPTRLGRVSSHPLPRCERGLLGFCDRRNFPRQTRTNSIQHRLEIGEHFIVIEAEHLVACRLQQGQPLFVIFFSLEVNLPLQLNDEFCTITMVTALRHPRPNLSDTEAFHA